MTNNLKEIKEFINQWKERAINYYADAIAEYKAERQIIYQIKDRDEYSKAMRNLREKYNQTIRDLAYGYSQQGMEERLLKIINREAEAKEKTLIARVNKAVGTIVEALSLNVGVNGELNGYIKGEKGTCKIETIYAGGYNIQCLHYRVLVKVCG